MATIKSKLKSQLDRNIVGDSTTKADGKAANNALLNSVMCSTYSDIVTSTSESGVINIPIVQPANTVIEDIVPIVTTALSHDSALIGFRVSSGSYGGTDVIAGTGGALTTPAATSTAVGTGTSIHAKVQASLGGGAALTILAGAGYTATERTLYAQVSGSTGAFDTDTGAVRVIAKYYNI